MHRRAKSKIRAAINELKKGKSKIVRTRRLSFFHSLHFNFAFVSTERTASNICENLGRKIQTRDKCIDDDCFSSFSKLTKFSGRKVRLDGKRPKQRSSVEQLGNNFLNAVHHSHLQELASDNRDSLQISAMAPIPY